MKLDMESGKVKPSLVRRILDHSRVSMIFWSVSLNYASSFTVSVPRIRDGMFMV